MSPKHSLNFLAVLAAVAVSGAHAGPPTPPPVDAATRQLVVDTLAKRLGETYVDETVGRATGVAMRDRQAHGAYAKDGDVVEFSEHLTRDLREAGHDLHFMVRFDPDFKEDAPGKVPTPAESAQARADIARDGFGVARVQRLAGNIGYIDVRGFPPLPYVAAAYSQAMSLLSGTDAIVVDLRKNGGGEPKAVGGFMSHFFGEEDDRHLNDIWWRPTGRTDESWTNGVASPRYLKPVIVLTSKYTFSGGEECAYDFQTQKRATLIGEVTGGGANPGDAVAIGGGFFAFIPSGKAINPVTHTNWEHVGVKPDVEVPAVDAMKTAYLRLLKELAAKAPEEDKDDYARWVAMTEKGEMELPGFTPPRRH